MKKAISVVIASLFLFFAANAQQKLGHINSVTILQAMPEFTNFENPGL